MCARSGRVDESKKCARPAVRCAQPALPDSFLLALASVPYRHIGDAIRRRERRVMGHAFRSVGTSAVDAQWHRMWLSRAGRLSCFSGEDSPLVGDAFQRLRPAVGEVDAGTGDEVFDGRGDEYLTGPRERAYTRADVHRDTREVIAS
jgi:hypothetical protein